MALKKNGDRIKVMYSIKKSTADRIRVLAEKHYRPMGQMLDKIIDEYVDNETPIKNNA